jgi:hypothetical protein
MTKQIKASLGFNRLPGRDLLARLEAVVKGMDGNATYPNPPVDMASLKTAGTNYSASLAAALDGGKKAIAERNAQRENVIKMLRQLAKYAEISCKDDRNTFLSSGFETASVTRVAPQPLDPPVIRSVDQGNTGQLLVSVGRSAQAKSYELRAAAAPAVAAATVPSWTTIGFTAVKQAIPVKNLIPGTTYIIQVRALGALGYSDWSDSITRMCT